MSRLWAISSLTALEMAAKWLPTGVERFQIDLLNLGWERRWDTVFLLDVIEHIPDHVAAVREVSKALKPGGLAFVTVPAFDALWSYNDDLAGHQRRYTRRDLAELARQAGLEVVTIRYFMLFLSPLLVATRLIRRVDVSELTDAERRELVTRTHRTPANVVNEALAWISGAETPLGLAIRSPFGTSVLAVLRAPAETNS